MNEETKKKLNQKIYLTMVAYLSDDVGGPEEILPTHDFIDDFHADSLDMVELIIEIEDAFDIEIKDDSLKIVDMETVGDLYKYFEENKIG